RDEYNEVSGAVPGNGQHTYSFTTTLTGTLTFATIPYFDVTQNASGGFSFCDRNQDRKADDVGTGSVLFTAVNGVSVPPSTILVNQTIPANGTFNVTIDSATRNQLARVVAWQDRNQNTGIELVAAGDTSCGSPQPNDSANDGVLTVWGRKFYFGPQGGFGAQFTRGEAPPGLAAYLHGTPKQPFSACDDVRLTFTAPGVSSVTSYRVQRAFISSTIGSANATNCRLGATAPQSSDSSAAPAGSTFVTVGAVTVAAGKQGTFTNVDLANGGWCYRVVVQNPNVGLQSFSNYVPVNIPGFSDASAPTSTSARRT